MDKTSWPLSTRDVLGLPKLPPSRAVRAGAAMRARLGAMHDRMALPFQVLLERIVTTFDGPALAAAVDLDIPRHLDRPRTAAELAQATGADAQIIDRLCAYLTARGCMKRDRKGRYKANGVTRLLDGTEWVGWVRFAASEWSYAAMHHIAARARTGAEPMVAAHGVDFFAYLAAHPDAAAAFHDSQAAGARLQSVILAEAVDVRAVQSVCDVGGGTGSLLTQMLTRHPHLRGCVVDLPEAEAGARATFAGAGIAGRAEFVAGDFFAEVPSGHDLHVLTAIVHDWGDDDVVRILRQCAAALVPGGRVVVVESILTPGSRASFAQLADALMLAYTRAGRERSAEEFAALWERAGLQCTYQKTLPSLFEMFELQPTQGR